jgi:hypothetical protein
MSCLHPHEKERGKKLALGSWNQASVLHSVFHSALHSVSIRSHCCALEERLCEECLCICHLPFMKFGVALGSLPHAHQ